MIRFFVITYLLFATPCHLFAFDIDIARVALNTGTGTQNITFSNFTEDCTSVTCAALFIVTTGISDGIVAGDAMLGVGFTDGTVSSSQVSRSATGGVSSTDSFRGQRANTELIHTITLSGIEGYATFSAWLSNGLTINIVDDFAAQYLLTVVLFGGSELSADADIFLGNTAIDGTTDVTTVGFEADLVFLATNRLSGSGDTGATSYVLSFGVALNDGSDTQGSIGCWASDGESSGNPIAITSSQYAIQTIDEVETDDKGAALLIGSWDASGFTATTKEDTVGAGWGVSYLALAISGLNTALPDIDTPTSTGSATVSVGFQSLFGMIMGTLAQAYDTAEADSDGGACMVSVATADSQYANMNYNEDAASTTNAGSISNDEFILMEQDDGSCGAGSCLAGTLSSFGATQWNLSYSSVFSDAARKWVGLAIESPVTPATRRRFGVVRFQ